MSKIIGWTLAAAAAFGASAIAAAPAQAQYYGQRHGYGNDRGFERHAVNICRHQAQRRYARRGARVDVRDVHFLRNGRIRVLGAVELRGNRWDRRWDRRYDRRYDRRWNHRGRIAFSCDVNRRGRLSRFRTHNYRW